ncbi:MAG: cytochrome c biogenesis protein CcsA [Planctomycetota bacterium]
MSTSARPGMLQKQEVSDRTLLPTDDALLHVAKKLASLKITCVLFTLAMFIIFVGSLAQARRDVWQVMAQYFRTWVAWVDVQDMFPPSMFGEMGNRIAERLGIFRYFPFPGGWTIGVAMLINLTCAHALTFKLRAKGGRLSMGVGMLLVGLLMTIAVIVTGNQQTGVEAGDTLLTPIQIWWLMLGVLGLSGLASVFAGLSLQSSAKLGRWILIGIGIFLLGVLAYFVRGGEEARLNLSSMRILWQLFKGSACSLVLLIGCNLLFEKRGGVVLLHIGVATLMISELQVGLWAKENMLHLVEGQTSNLVRDIRTRELSIVSKGGDGQAKVVAIPEDVLLNSAGQQAADVKEVSPRQIISLPKLPFDLAVREYYQNSRLRPLTPKDHQLADKGMGSFAVPVRLDPVTGMDEKSDSSSAVVDVIDRETKKTLKTLLVTQSASEDRAKAFAEIVNHDGKEYAFFLRFKRDYRGYDVKLLDVSRRLYVGSSTPRDYRSKIEISDRQSGETQQFEIYMNNPLRYQGETFYQTSYQDLGDGKEASTISVVDNTGWMLPYIACMLVTFGMFGQFGQTLNRFLARTERAGIVVPKSAGSRSDNSESLAAESASSLPLSEPKSGRSVAIAVATAVTLIFAAWLGSSLRVPSAKSGQANLYEFGRLPIVWRGRVQPIDSVARMELLMNSHKSTFECELDATELGEEKQREKIRQAFVSGWSTAPSDWIRDFNGSYQEWIDQISRVTAASHEAVESRMRSVMVSKKDAIRWMLDVMARPEVAARHRVIRIDNDQVLALLALDKRHGMTYSIDEIRKNMSNLQKDFESANEKNQNGEENRLSARERQVMNLFSSLNRISTMQDIFSRDRFSQAEDKNLAAHLVGAWDVFRRLENAPAIMSVPTGKDGDRESWETFVAAVPVLHLNEQMNRLGITSEPEIVSALLNTLPAEIMPRDKVATAVRLNFPMLAENIETPDRQPPTPEAIRKAAAEASEKLSLSDPGLSGVLNLIAVAPLDRTPEQIAESVTEEQAREIGLSSIASQFTVVLEQLLQKDPSSSRLAALREKLNRIGLENRLGFSQVMIEEGTKIVWEDLQKRAAWLLPGGPNAEMFCRNAASLKGILTAWETQDANRFNEDVGRYAASITAEKYPQLDASIVSLEARFNHYEPFYKATYPYLFAIVFTFFGWIGMERPMRFSGLGLMMLALVIHTAALYARMMISGRPPVTNLYSSAIFIGWGAAVAAIVIEFRLKNGIGTLLGSAIGAGSLVIAHYLARGEGDTLGVMQAVLDTTFWLATHVVCITLGYAATFVAGFLGLLYAIQAVMGRSFSASDNADFSGYMKDFGKIVYGTLCFALFFSLVGTVLGGLWADDSWGRFWGWDPKENGAMMIVLWNALILHARWDKMIGDFGTSVLAMLGNVVTSWSWFGVNELGAGLHEYGFTEGRLLALTSFVAVQLVVVIGFSLFSNQANSNVTNKAAA